MHPAPSVIIFTVFSGLGFGMLFMLGTGVYALTGWTAFYYFFAAFAMAVGGLMASTFHLGNPKNALKAFTQWRTSWLSREAWMAMITLSIAGLYAAAAIFLDKQIVPLGMVAGVLALITVYTTSMMYAQLKTVPRWNHWTTSALFILLALEGGAIAMGDTLATLVSLTLAAVVQTYVWVAGDKRFAQRGHTIETATGLGNLGKVRLVEKPHSGKNYLLTEMVYVVARKHVPKLRLIAVLLMFALPILFVTLSSWHGSFYLNIPALASYVVGVLVQRWLFFAEAEHVVGLYYDAR